MSILGFFTVLFPIVCAVILAEMYREQHSFCVTHYEVHSPKITCTAEKDPVNRIIFLSDMHNHVYGKQNNKLFEAIKAEQPAAARCPDDPSGNSAFPDPPTRLRAVSRRKRRLRNSRCRIPKNLHI